MSGAAKTSPAIWASRWIELAESSLSCREIQATAESVAFSLCNPLATVLDNLISSGLSEVRFDANSQNDAINDARSTDNFESAKPASIIGTRAAAARRRFNSGVGGGINFGIM